MEMSRTREFGQYRSQSNSNRSEVTSMTGSRASITSVPSQACCKCINVMMADQKRKKGQKQKEKQQDFMKKSLKLINQSKDSQDQYRKGMKMEALKYNASMISQHQILHKQQMAQDVAYAQKIKNQVEEAEKSFHHQLQRQKRRQRQFYKQLKSQYLDALDKKDKSRFSRDQDSSYSGLPFEDNHHKQLILQHQRELRQQISEKKRRERQDKIRQRKLEQQKLIEFHQEAEKYHHDNIELGHKKNPQLLSQVKQIQNSRHEKAKEQRKMNNEQRLQAIRRQNQLKSQMMKQKMTQMQNYVHDLKMQMVQKQQRMRQSRFQESKFRQSFAKSTQQVKQEQLVKKQCKSCHQNFPIEYISKVPKV